jgi:hypothetical protein
MEEDKLEASRCSKIGSLLRNGSLSGQSLPVLGLWSLRASVTIARPGTNERRQYKHQTPSGYKLLHAKPSHRKRRKKEKYMGKAI